MKKKIIDQDKIEDEIKYIYFQDKEKFEKPL